MKTKYVCVLLLFTAIFLSQCKKEPKPDINNPSELRWYHGGRPDSTLLGCDTSFSINLVEEHHKQGGKVTIRTAATDLVVTYNASYGNYFKKLRLYVGDCDAIPGSGHGQWGVPDPDDFPATGDFDDEDGVQTDSFIIPLTNLSNCFCIVAYATLQKQHDNHGYHRRNYGWNSHDNHHGHYGGGYNGHNGGNHHGGKGGDGHHGNDNDNEDGYWGEGTIINSYCHHGETKVVFCKPECSPQGCVVGPELWFGSGEPPWGPTVVVGGYTYNTVTARDIYNSSSTSNSRIAFIWIASLKLSENSVSASATVWGDVAVVEAWLSTVGELSLSNLPVAPPNVALAIQNIQTWANNHLCP